MGGKLYLSLIFCAYLSQEIGALSEDNIEVSSNLQVRKKRVIDYSQINKPVKIVDVPYIVNILKNRQRECAGSILTNLVVITAAVCVAQPGQYSVLSGSANVNKGTYHEVVRKIIQRENTNRGAHTNDLALLKLSPPIDLLHSPNRPISLHPVGDIPTYIPGKFSGWGCTEVRHEITAYPNELHSINVPIINHQMCQKYFPDHQHTLLANNSICTYDASRHKGSCDGDIGGPLVVQGRLVGVMAWTEGLLTHPDVFINLSERQNQGWVNINQGRLQRSITTGRPIIKGKITKFSTCC